MSEDPTHILERSDVVVDDATHPLVFARRWRAVALLGTGGMGSVYLARDLELGELVALKTVQPSYALDASSIERFRDEVRLARRVSSPYVARTHDLGEDDGRIFLTMQYIDGETLATRLQRDGAMRIADVVRLAHDLAAGLDAVHAAGIVHRDLKPGNVMLAKDGTAILTDFGIALRASGAASTDRSGTPTYTAPEQLAGGAVDRRADVFAMGALLYAAATGRRPFPPDRTGREPPPDPRAVLPSLPDAFRMVVMRAMSVDPAGRYASAAELYQSLATLASPRAARSESALFDFVRSLVGNARHVAVGELRCPDDRTALRNAVRSHLVELLEASGELAESPVHDATEAILDGSIAEQAGDCILDLELRSRDGDAFWRRSFRAPLGSLASVVESAAGAAARALSASCGANVTPSFASAEAAELFLAARAEYRRFWLVHEERAMDLLERADALEPNHPSVVAWKAVTQARLRFMHDAGDRAARLVARAFELGGAREPEAHLALAHLHAQDMRLVDSLRETLIALRLTPGLVDARAFLVVLLDEVGATSPTVKLANAVRASDAEATEVVAILIRVAGIRGALDEIATLAASVPRESPGYTRTNLALMRQAMWHRKPSLGSHVDGPPDEISMRALVIVRAVLAGERPRSLEEFDGPAATVSPRRRAIMAQLACELHAYLGDDDAFFSWLDRAVALGVFDLAWIDGCPLFAPYRGVVHFESARQTIHARALEALTEAERVLEAPLHTLL